MESHPRFKALGEQVVRAYAPFDPERLTHSEGVLIALRAGLEAAEPTSVADVYAFLDGAKEQFGAERDSSLIHHYARY